jgi:hypothetical protein
MADYGTYNFPDHLSGTTMNEKIFTFSAHPSGILIKVELETSRGESLKSGVGITITDAVNWEFKINTQGIGWSKGDRTYGIVTISSDGVVKTFIRGTINII